MNEQIISQVPLFTSLPVNEIKHLAETLHPSEVLPGTILFREGEHGDRFYIVREGQIEIIKALGTPDERLIGVRGPGEHVGEMSLFNRDGLRTASARTQTTTQVLVMTRADFDALLNRQPTLAYEMVRVLSMRLHQAHNTTIRDLHEKNRQLTEAYESLKAAQAQIIEKEKLEHELHVAREVQASLLPRTAPQLPGWEFVARWQPAREVSGDFYDFIPLPAAHPPPASAPNWGLVIADVSDKGMPAALFMALTRSIVRASVTGVRSPADCITQANRLVCADAAQGMFVTLFYAQLDPATGDLTYVNAGHNPPWLYRAEDDQWTELTRTGMALGMFQAHVLTQNILRLNAGDLLFMYTDGLTDVTNRQGQRFETEQLRRVVHASRRAPAAEMAARLDEAVSRFSGGHTPFDDITFVVAKRV
ncbi:MAG: SpoIIE family protein phosphatase [Chloroflexota bacterium]